MTQNGKLKTLPDVVRELERKLPRGPVPVELELYKKVLAQERTGKNKI